MKTHKGFTLVELFVTVLIIAVLAAIAYPQYMKVVYKTNRSEAKTWLNDSAQLLQRCYTAYGKFNDGNCEIYTKLTGAGVTSKDRGFYSIKIDGSKATATTYELTATAILKPQTGDKSPDCTVMTLNSKGNKGPVDCW